MKSRLTALAGVAMAFALAACSTAPTARSLVQDAVTAMGGAEGLRAIRTITMKGGAGTRSQLQEGRHVGEEEAPATLANVVEVVDLAGGRASIDYEVNNAGFMQHRHEVLTRRGGKGVGIEYVGTRPVIATSVGGLFSWGTQNTPVMTLRRNPTGRSFSARGRTA